MSIPVWRRLLQAPEMIRADVNNEERFRIHGELLARKPILKSVFRELHAVMMDLDRTYFNSTEGAQIELGAGVCPIKQSYPSVLATDVMMAPGLDRVLDAQSMDLPSGSVRTLFGQNCFHHFSDPERFFTESRRVLNPGGGIVLIEPYFGPLASLLYPRMHATEGFDKDASAWTTPLDGAMRGANQALSYIVFTRDRARFRDRFGDFEIVHLEPLRNWLRYLLSGGLNFRQLAPSFLNRPLMAAEVILSPLARWLALHYVIVVRYSPTARRNAEDHAQDRQSETGRA